MASPPGASKSRASRPRRPAALGLAALVPVRIPLPHTWTPSGRASRLPRSETASDLQIGVDLAPVSKIRRVFEGRAALLEDVFTQEELRYSFRRRRPFEHLAARYAAKEAVFKGLRTGVTKVFGKHGFNLSHAVAYGIVAYWSMYFKRHHPREFYWAQLVKAIHDSRETGRFINEATRKGIPFAAVSRAMNQESWYIDANGSIATGWQPLHGVGPKAAAELALHAPYASMEDLEARVNKRIVNKTVRTAIENAIGKTPAELFGVMVWSTVDRIITERNRIEELWDDTVPLSFVTIAGRVLKINKKNRFEELTSKGRSTDGYANDSSSDYVVMVVEDATEQCRLMLSIDVYNKYRDEVWRCLK